MIKKTAYILLTSPFQLVYSEILLSKYKNIKKVALIIHPSLNENSFGTIKKNSKILGYSKILDLRSIGKKIEKIEKIRILQKIPIKNKVTHHITKKYHYIFTKIRNNHYLNIKKFEYNIQIFLDLVNPKHAIFIEISEPGNSMINKVYNIKEDIIKYNESLRKMGIAIYPYQVGEKKHLRDDGHHLNDYGHQLVFDKIVEVLNNYLI